MEKLARKNGDMLIPTCRFEGARCGYIDRRGNTVIAPQFEWVDLFVAGRALVVSDGKYGAIDLTGRFVIAPVYDSMSRFDQGLALVLVGDRLGVIDEDSRWIVPADHGEDGSFQLGPLKLARSVLTSGSGEYSIEFEEGYRRLDKALVTELARNPDALTRSLPLLPRLPWSEGLAAKFDDNTSKWGFIDPSGKFVIAPQFDAVGFFKNGSAWAAFPDRGEWCLIDKAGHIKPGHPVSMRPTSRDHRALRAPAARRLLRRRRSHCSRLPQIAR